MRIRFIRAVLFACVVFVMSSASASFAQEFRFSVSFGPPALPVYEQPVCPGEGYIWTPGYWTWSDDEGDYYWVPGTWVLAPEPGYLWTPPYWAWHEGRYVFYDGYWGPHVGFYGGINYGFGYSGEGFEGGRWDNGRFFYNRSVTNVNVTTIHNVYNTTVVNNRTTINRVSYNGGEGGISARPTAQQEAVMHERHIPPAAAQNEHMQAARGNPELRASANHGKPPVAATARPGAFRGGEALAAREAGAPYHPPANHEPNQPRGSNGGPNREATPARSESAGHPSSPANHPKDLAPMDRPAAPHTGNAKTDQKYQQQQEKLQQKQDQQRQKLQQQQDRDHQRLAQQKVDEARKQQTEQKHQQQTQQLQQRHEQQQQKMQQKQAPQKQAQPKQAPPQNHPESKPPKGGLQ